MILSSKEKIKFACLITLGIVKEAVSIDGCQSIAKHFTELELTAYNPTVRRNIKLVSMFCPKPGENSSNVSKMLKCFDQAVNKALPDIAIEYNLDPKEYVGKGLDPDTYVGDEGGALWAGLSKVKGHQVKNKTVSDKFHLTQDITRHQKLFSDKKDQVEFRKMMK